MNDKLQKLDMLQRKQIAFNHAMGLISYDGSTTAPAGTASNRAETLGILSEEAYKLATCEETISLIDELFAEKDTLNFTHRRIVEEMHKSIDEMRKIPMDEYIAYQKLSVEADVAWKKAKENIDYPFFMP